jgi:hypothetical protein
MGIHVKNMMISLGIALAVFKDFFLKAKDLSLGSHFSHEQQKL